MKASITLLALAAVGSAAAQVFTPKTDLPQPLERSFSFVVDGKLYAGTGRDDAFEMHNHIWQFDLLVGLDETNPGFSEIKITAADGFLTASIPPEVFQKFEKKGLALELWTTDGRLAESFSLFENEVFDRSRQPAWPLVWVVRAGGRALKSGKIVR